MKVCRFENVREHIFQLIIKDMYLMKLYLRILAPNKVTICDWICEKVPFPHILHTSKQNEVTLDY